MCDGLMANSKTAFVTVGSTKFDDLIAAATSTDCLQLLAHLGYTHLLLQVGNSHIPAGIQEREDPIGPLRISWYKFKPSLAADIAAADLVLSHAGAGTCLEVQAARRPHLVVSNPRLMGNHQLELAEKLVEGGHLLHCLPSHLTDGIRRMHGQEGDKLTPLPPGDPKEFAKALDKVVSDIYSED